MNAKKIFLLILVMLSFSSAVMAEDLPPNDATRFVTLTKEIRCVVCQNQNLADSTAPIADDLRQKIYTMILEKKSDEEIKDFLVKRYGEFILLRPRFSATTLFLWLFPILGIIGIIWYFYRFKQITA